MKRVAEYIGLAVLLLGIVVGVIQVHNSNTNKIELNTAADRTLSELHKSDVLEIRTHRKEISAKQADDHDALIKLQTDMGYVKDGVDKILARLP